MEEKNETITATLLRHVDGWKGYVAARVATADIDDVLQSAREVLVRHAADYDRELGEPGAFVFGVVRNMTKVARRTAARSPLSVAEVRDAEDAASRGGALGDPAAYVSETRDASSAGWLSIVADAATPFEWSVVVTLVETESSSAHVAELMGVTSSTVRAASGRVAALARTARFAIERCESGQPATLEDCAPREGGYAAAAKYLSVAPKVASVALGVTEGTFRNRRALLHRLGAVVRTVNTAMPVHRVRSEVCMSSAHVSSKVR